MAFPIAKEGEELQAVDQLIASTERQLTVYRDLHALIQQFQQQQESFHNGSQTKELAHDMVMTALKIYRTAEEHALMHLFSPFFIQELQLFSGVARKVKESP